jgi:hypothetical protein
MLCRLLPAELPAGRVVGVELQRRLRARHGDAHAQHLGGDVRRHMRCARERDAGVRRRLLPAAVCARPVGQLGRLQCQLRWLRLSDALSIDTARAVRRRLPRLVHFAEPGLLRAVLPARLHHQWLGRVEHLHGRVRRRNAVAVAHHHGAVVRRHLLRVGDRRQSAVQHGLLPCALRDHRVVAVEQLQSGVRRRPTVALAVDYAQRRLRRHGVPD